MALETVIRTRWPSAGRWFSEVTALLGESIEPHDMIAARARASDEAFVAAIRAGNMTEALKHYRALYQVDLKTAQEAVDAIARGQP